MKKKLQSKGKADMNLFKALKLTKDEDFKSPEKYADSQRVTMGDINVIETNQVQRTPPENNKPKT